MEYTFKKIHKVSNLRRIDEYTIENESIKSLDLMERAARAVVSGIQKKIPKERVFNIFVGPGNNGGDGYAIARMLLEDGCEVCVYAISIGNRTIDCEENRRRYLGMGGKCIEIGEGDSLLLPGKGVWIDAIFGAGLNRSVSGWIAGIIRQMNDARGIKVAVDMPSGLFGEDNTNNTGVIFRADYTFTFQFPKLAFMLADNYPYVGEFEVLDIHLHPRILASLASDWFYITEDVVADKMSIFHKFDHKGILGHALLVAGSYAMPGAAVLAGRATLRSGVGLLSMHVPRSLKDIIHCSLPEVLVVLDKDESCFSGLVDESKYQAIGIGPGLGVSGKSVEGLQHCLSRYRGGLVLDADALNILAAHRGMLSLLPENTILTPHIGEFERLVGKCQNDFDRLNKLSNFAKLYHVYVVLKGAHTVIAAPGGKFYFNMNGNPGMAKGGAGDVLTGVITALLAGGVSPLDASIIGVFVHGMAGDLARKVLGMRGMCTGDLVKALGKVWCYLEKLKREL